MPLWLHGSCSNYTYQCRHSAGIQVYIINTIQQCCHSAGVLSGRCCHSAVMDFCHIATVLLYKSGSIATVLSQCWHIILLPKTARLQFYFEPEFSRWLSGFLENWILAVCQVAALVQFYFNFLTFYVLFISIFLL